MTPVTPRSTPPTAPAETVNAPAEPNFRAPRISDGIRMWQIARDSKVLDVNSSYAYVLWCRDFAATSVVATAGDHEAVGFVSGYRRPEAPDTLFVWQVAVDQDQRGRGVAGRMLDSLWDRLTDAGVTRLETTVSPDNEASIAMFTALARRRGLRITRSELFTPSDFPDSHMAEDLYTIGE
ncbi:diaminobutyrate acetyltransferase [Rhodococcus ruber]|nr:MULTISPECIES: diaminobutyrate acetyltransferase [Rhodococcus]MCD2126397.1 diaminobutyrate acetyltransferase [Rhodococcus ruber]MCZ1074082.1 diaminobutyrate acetyltransferase [Rhodococcus sp. A5(2022)]MCZ4502726.1 diaminobutyrate acetyltransferase [Rhodococcus ruber]MCZ4529685.1 diaminobutyrate acetyltransferase [Rhodococcus ruber]MCZ4619899.1 diaminobutyrate acetyltransferase [Rhodococcus ruber]